jgi:hypothetical protein
MLLTLNEIVLKERLDAGNFELPLCNITAQVHTNATGSVSVWFWNTYSLIDDSSLASPT